MQNDGTSANSVQLLWNDLGFSSHTHKILLHNHTNLYTVHVIVFQNCSLGRFFRSILTSFLLFNTCPAESIFCSPQWPVSLSLSGSVWILCCLLVSLFQSVFVHISIFLSLSLSVSFFQCLSACLPASQPSAPFWSLPVCLSLCFHLCFSFSLSLSVSFNLYLHYVFGQYETRALQLGGAMSHLYFSSPVTLPTVTAY